MEFYLIQSVTPTGKRPSFDFSDLCELLAEEAKDTEI